MTDKLPIDYARAESADVVRKKFRRRVIWFVAATVALMLIGVGWRLSWTNPLWNKVTRENFWNPPSPKRVELVNGWIALTGPRRNTALDVNQIWFAAYGNPTIGIDFVRYHRVGEEKWRVGIRYRTLFILAMISWIITLIRMIRIRRRMHRLET